MASARVNFSVGLFMTAGLALATVAIIWLGMSSFLRTGQLFVTYFNESVQGLGVDSPVKYRGVPVGRVKSIGIAPDYLLVEVLIQIDDEHAGDERRFDNAVAALANVGITGAMFVEIDKAPGDPKELTPTLSFTPGYPVIASRPSEIKKLFQEIQDIASKFKLMNFKEISDQAINAFKTLNTSIEAAQIGVIAADIRTLVENINAAANPKRLESMARNMDQTILSSRTLMEQATADLVRMNAILVQFQGVVEANRPHVDTAMGAMASTAVKTDAFLTQSQAAMLQMQSSIKHLEERLASTADNLEQTSSKLNALITTISYQPSQLLFGQPQTPRPVEE